MTNADALSAVLTRAEARGWAGADPYDGLSSPLAGIIIPLGKFPRFVFAQTVLRVPLARALAQPPPTVNPKGLALFMGAAVRGRHLLGDERARSVCESLRSGIDRLGIRVGSGIGWGYPFPWQSRSFWAPAGTPNAVVTATVGWRLLDVADAFGDTRAQTLGESAAEFLTSGLNESRIEAAASISYTKSDRTRVVNVSALAARLLVRVARSSSPGSFGDLAERLVQFVLREQREDGSWPYSSDPGGGWEDSFHTGFVLEALLNVRELGIPVPDEILARGFAAYARFFGADGGARLHPSPTSSLDAHSAAQGIVTYAALDSSSLRSIPGWQGAGEMALRIASWARDSLWLPSKGYFAHRIRDGRRDEREFTRWVQAWMALAMATAGTLEVQSAVSPGSVSTAGVA